MKGYPTKRNEWILLASPSESAHTVAARLLDLMQGKFNLRFSFRNKLATWGGSRQVCITESVAGEDTAVGFPD